MSDDLTFRHLTRPKPGAEMLTFRFEGEAVDARAGDSIAAALLAAGHTTFRASAVSGAPRGPFCMMGACFECLVEVDGSANRQACMTAVRAGMTVRRMAGARLIGNG